MDALSPMHEDRVGLRFERAFFVLPHLSYYVLLAAAAAGMTIGLALIQEALAQA